MNYGCNQISDKALNVFPMAYYFSAVEAFEKRIMAAECSLDRSREKLDGHYRAFITYLNAVQELQPEESLSKAAQYYNADLAKIDLQYQQSRKKGGLPDQTGTALSTAE